MSTLKDIAREAGVSIKTASRVINGEAPIRPETRSRVQAVIDRLGYEPSHAARMMRTRRSGVVGFMTDVVASTPYSVDMVRGMQDELRAFGKTMLIANTERDAQREREFLRMFRQHRVEGMVFASMFHRRLHTVPEAGAPLVLLNCYADDWQGASLVPDDHGGGYAAARYLLDQGHRRLGVISLNPVLPATQLRLAALRTALAERGLSLSPDLVQCGFVGPLEAEQLSAFEAAMEMLRRPDRPSAILCGNDQIALQVYCAAQARGLQVPGDLSVMGFDDLKLISETLRPALTTVALPYAEMGRLAVRALVDPSQAPMSTVPQRVPCLLRVRDSVAPPTRP